jgi:hypothetical protein
VKRRTMTFLWAEDMSLADCRMGATEATKKVQKG